MTKTRINKSYGSLPEIIEALSKNPHASGVWVGENYSKQDLIDDLTKLQKLKEVSQMTSMPCEFY